MNLDKENNNEKKQNVIENKYKVVYSPYGYIKILEKDLSDNSLTLYDFIQYKNNICNISNNYFIGTISKNSIKNDINIRLKYFSGSRKIISMEKININSKLNILVEKIPIEDIDNYDNKKLTKNSQHRLFSCKTGLRELNPNCTFIESNLQDNELILFFKEIPLTFSSSMKGKSIELSQGYKTAFKTTTDDPQYVLGNNGYSSGRHYFEINLLTDPMIRSVVVGFSTKKDDKNLFAVDIDKFYGFILSDMKKTTITMRDGGENMEDYGEVCNISDKIGVLFDCKHDGIYINFYRNKKNLGNAFAKLPSNLVYYPTVEIGLCGSKIQINNALDFPDL